MGIRSGLGMVVATAVGATLMAPVGPAAAETTTDAVEAMEVVPGLVTSVEAHGDAALLDDGLGVTVDGTSGASIAIERLHAESLDVTATDEGQTVVEGTSTDTDTVIQEVAGGARVLEVIGSDEAPASFSYGLDVPEGMSLLEQEDGSVLVGNELRRGDTVTFEVDGVIGAPWAVDATGRAVPVSYEVGADDVLTMHVEHGADVTYPVVADPTFTKGGFKVVFNTWTPWAVTVYLNKARTGDAEDVGAAVCIGVGFVPVVGPYVAALCGLHNIVIRATSRYGYCQYWVVNTATRTFDVRLYRGGFCT